MAFPPVIINRKGKSMAIITIGIDLAKNVFAGHSVDETGKPMLVKPKVQRANLFWLAF
jgi:transposase